MSKRSITIILVLAMIVATGTIHAGDGAKCKGGLRGRIIQIGLRHAPKMVRIGADLYSIRLELIHAFFTQDEYDRKTAKLVSHMAKGIEKMGFAVVALVADVREEIPHGRLWRVFRRKGKRARGKGKGQGKRRWKRWRKRAQMHRHLLRRARRVLRGLELSEQQRFDMKLVALAWTPTIVGSGGQAMAEGISLVRHLVGKKFDRKTCEASVNTMSKHVKSMLEAVVKLSYAIRAKMTKPQIRRLLANMPLRLLFLR